MNRKLTYTSLIFFLVLICGCKITKDGFCGGPHCGEHRYARDVVQLEWTAEDSKVWEIRNSSLDYEETINYCESRGGIIPSFLEVQSELKGGLADFLSERDLVLSLWTSSKAGDASTSDIQKMLIVLTVDPFSTREVGVKNNYNDTVCILLD